MNLAHEIQQLVLTTKIRKALHLATITVNGVAHNEYWGEMQSEVTENVLISII